jgi:hypothetical protein
MKIQLEHKFQIGQTVFVALRPDDVCFDNKLPIVEMEIEGVKYSGRHYSDKDDSTLDLIYILREKGGFASAHERECSLYETKESAYEKALMLTNKNKQKAEEELKKINSMLSAHNKLKG